MDDFVAISSNRTSLYGDRRSSINFDFIIFASPLPLRQSELTMPTRNASGVPLAIGRDGRVMKEVTRVGAVEISSISVASPSQSASIPAARHSDKCRRKAEVQIVVAANHAEHSSSQNLQFQTCEIDTIPLIRHCSTAFRRATREEGTARGGHLSTGEEERKAKANDYGDFSFQKCKGATSGTAHSPIIHPIKPSSAWIFRSLSKRVSLAMEGNWDHQPNSFLTSSWNPTSEEEGRGEGRTDRF
jgi:hypothetical protein